MADIMAEFGYTPTAEQAAVIRGLERFVASPIEPKAFILKGFAGTGKTTVLSALVRALPKTVLMAPTGRAAKVFAQTSGHPATSIHKLIYRQAAAGAASFSLNYNNHSDTIYIIDEASMVANSSSEGSMFGSGRLLDDLIEYIYTGDRCAAIFLGDPAQLLPIGHTDSPALSKSALQRYGLTVGEMWLTEVIRQHNDSGILENATRIRTSIETEPFTRTKLTDLPRDVIRVTGENLPETLEDSYSRVGPEETIILTYSNRRAVQYNMGVRNQVLYREERLQAGDMVVITKNNYFWSRPYDNLAFIANGDTAEIVRVGRHEELYGVEFAELTLRLMDYDIEITAKAILDTLYAETPADITRLTNSVAEQIVAEMETRDKAKVWRALKQNEYFNALQLKFAYAVTGHKAQGGAWEHVYVDLGYLTEEMIDRQYYQWLYTAFTRAKERLYLVNFPDRFFDTNNE